MSDNNKFCMNEGLLQHFDAAMEDEKARLKDSDRYMQICQLEQKYSPTKFLNEGGMKQILFCRDLYTERDVAMAVPKDDLDAEGIDAFIQEARISASLEHPNIVPVHELSVDEGRPFFTMKILHGENLAEVIKNIKKENYREKYNQQSMLEIFLKICDAISFAHSKNIMHLDIKPANIQISEFGEVLVCDWGLAAYIDDQMTKTNKIVGTPGFMSPEQIVGEGISPLTDIYSLGCLLYAMLLHQLPVGGHTDKDLKENTCAGELKEPENLPVGLKAVLKKAIALDPQERYQSCRQLAADIRAYQSGFATQAEDAGFLTLSILLIKRYKVLAGTISAFILCLIILTTTFINNLNREKLNAIDAQSAAEMARDEAERAQEDSMALRQMAAPNFIKYARREYARKNYEKTFKLTEKAIQLDPSNDNAHKFMMNLLVGRHQFQEAIDWAQGRDNDKYTLLVDLCHFCLKLQEKGSLILQQELIPKIKEMRDIPDAPHLRMHFLHHCTLLYELEDRLDFAKRYFRSITNYEYTFDLKEIEGGYSLSLANNNGMYNIVPLNNLPIIDLDISNTNIFDLRPLMNSKLKVLNITQTDVLDIEPLANCPLEKLLMYKTNIRHIQKLENTPLQEIALNNRWLDLSELKNFKSLKRVHIPQHTFNEENLRKLHEKYEVIFY